MNALPAERIVHAHHPIFGGDGQQLPVGAEGHAGDTPGDSVSARTCSPDFTSHTRAMLSAPAETSHAPSALKARSSTGSVCPSKSTRGVPGGILDAQRPSWPPTRSPRRDCRPRSAAPMTRRARRAQRQHPPPRCAASSSLAVTSSGSAGPGQRVDAVHMTLHRLGKPAVPVIASTCHTRMA